MNPFLTYYLEYCFFAAVDAAVAIAAAAAADVAVPWQHVSIQRY